MDVPCAVKYELALRSIELQDDEIAGPNTINTFLDNELELSSVILE